MQICHWQYIPLARELYRQHNALFHRTPTTRAYWGYIAEIFCRLCLNDLILPRFYVELYVINSNVQCIFLFQISLLIFFKRTSFSIKTFSCVDDMAL